VRKSKTRMHERSLPSKEGDAKIGAGARKRVPEKNPFDHLNGWTDKVICRGLVGGERENREIIKKNAKKPGALPNQKRGLIPSDSKGTSSIF